MARKLVSQMTPEEREEHRRYMSEAKARSRANRPEGTCVSCGAATSKRNGKYLASCATCNKRSNERDAANGYPMRPSVAIKRGAIRMRKQGMNLNDIVNGLREYGADRAYVRDILNDAGLM